MEPAGIKGWVCRFYDKNMHWLCQKRKPFLLLFFLMGVLAMFFGLTYHSLPGAGETVYRQSILARSCFFLLSFLWVIDFPLYSLTIKSKDDVYHRMPDSYKVFTCFRLVLCIGMLGISLFQTYKMFALLLEAGYTAGDLVRIFFTVDAP